MTWLPLVVAIVVALISAVGSYITARDMNSRMARQELQATKRTEYAAALADLESGHADKAKYGPRWKGCQPPNNLFTSEPELSEDDKARRFAEAQERISRAFATLYMLGGEQVGAAVDLARKSPVELREADFARLISTLREDLALGEDHMGRTPRMMPKLRAQLGRQVPSSNEQTSSD